MEIILLEDIEGVGIKGDLANVSPGYARNDLLPKHLAEVANPGRLDEVRRRMDERKAREARSADQAVDVAATLNKTVVPTIGAAMPARVSGSTVRSPTPTSPTPSGLPAKCASTSTRSASTNPSRAWARSWSTSTSSRGRRGLGQGHYRR